MSPVLLPEPPKTTRSRLQDRGVTLREIASVAKVSLMTASVIMRNKPGVPVAPETRRRVIEAAQQLGYRPNLAARSMKSGKSRQVGVLVRNNSRNMFEERGAHPLVWEFLLGINQGLEDEGYMMSLVRICEISDSESLSATALQGNLLDGIIVVNTVPSVSVEKVEEMAPVSIWLDANVWLSERCLRRNEVQTGTIVASELAALGYEHLILLRRPLPEAPHFSEAQRLQGLNETAQDRGLTSEEFSLPFTLEAAHWPKLWPKLHPKVAVVALDIYAAASIMTSASFDGPRPGRDFGLASCDDSFHTTGLGLEGLSRVSFHRFEMGVQSAQMMLQLIKEPTTPCPSQSTNGEWLQGISTPSRV